MQYHIECPDKDFDLILKEYKEIPLTQGKISIADVEDYEYLNQWKWHALRDGNTYYAIRAIPKDGKQTSISMHREILKTPKGMYTDHINMDGLDNRRDNLRICTRSQNQMNSEKHKNNNSGFKGVCWHIGIKKWMAQIKVDKKQICLGYFENKEEAALVYNEAAKKYHGEFAKLNNILGGEDCAGNLQNHT